MEALKCSLTQQACHVLAWLCCAPVEFDLYVSGCA